MDNFYCILTAVVITALSGLPTVFFSKRSLVGQRISATLLITGSLLGLTGTIPLFFSQNTPSLRLPWLIPWGQFSITADPLSAFFLLLIFSVPALGSLYSLGYWKQREHEENGRRLSFFYGLLTASMAMVVLSRDAVLFLFSWEIMALSAYFAATAEDHKPEVQAAGWIYLVATHIGTLVLFSLFLLWNNLTGSFALEAMPAAPAEIAGTIFVLAVIGFGFKAGIMPFHIWLPGAHSNAPSHVSAVMSGVMLKMGIYGIIRMSGLLPVNEPWWGYLLLILGVVTGIAGILYAMSQQDIKRVLAYSSIENIGIIFIGLGLALIGRSSGRFELVLLGLSGTLLHVLNHGFFKSLLFFNAGAVLHVTHTKDSEKLGGLMKKMPQTGVLFTIGAVAICALPPLNGFISEWLIYLGLFQTLTKPGKPEVILIGLAVVALAMIGSLAIAAMAKLMSTIFLGSPRSDSTAHAHDPSFSMRLPMFLAAAVCLTIGLFPYLITPALEKAVTSWTFAGGSPATITSLVPFKWISFAGLSILSVILLLAIYLKIKAKKRPAQPAVTWDCGYAVPTTKMQYTGRSFVQTLIQLFSVILWPKSHPVKMQQYFPKKAQYSSQVPDGLLDRIVLPVFHFLGKYLPWVRVFQQGQTQVYVLYILAVVLVLLIF